VKVPFLDLKPSYDELRDELDAALLRVARSGWYILGEEVERFEGAFTAYVGAGHCVGVANGLDALVLALRALDIGPGDEVIVPSNTYIATWLAVSQVGATPVPVEPDAKTHNIDPGLVEAALTSRTRALLPVHLYGQPADLDPLLELARARGLKVVEDAAQAQGATYKDARIGGHGDAVAWSFFPTKNLGALGDAGAVTTNDAAVADRIRVLRNYGSREKYVCEVRGVNSRLDPMQAAALGVKLKHLDAWNERRRRLARRYIDALAGSGVGLPATPQWCESVWHQFVIRVGDRDGLQRHLAAEGIGTLIHYPIPPHLQGAYGDGGHPSGSLPIAEGLAREVLSLPISPQLSDADQDAVISAIRHWAS
jgi:dTDP-4-amino-4,6-dideoxygalactose transaminase